MRIWGTKSFWSITTRKNWQALRNGDVPIHENFLPELLARHRGQRIKFSGDLQAATRESDAVFIAVGTPPTESGDADLSYVESVAREISGGIDGYKVVVEKSTVPVYTNEWIRTIIMRNGADPAAVRHRVESRISCAKERRSPTSSIPTASWSESKTSRLRK